VRWRRRWKRRCLNSDDLPQGLKSYSFLGLRRSAAVQKVQLQLGRKRNAICFDYAPKSEIASLNIPIQNGAMNSTEALTFHVKRNKSNADCLLDCFGDGGRVVLHFFCGLGFYHYAGQFFSAGIADNHAAGIAQILFGSFDGCGDWRQFHQRRLLSYFNVADDLREHLQVRNQLCQ
jgi:hypothetical protein